MKPLEKVVKALEICGKVDPSLCPYFDTKHWKCCTGYIQRYSPVKDDAYSYLREYLNYQKSQKTINKSDSLSETENKPLSWEELRQMVGKPVWLEELRDGSRWYGFWDVVSDAVDYGDEKIVYTKSEMRYEMAEYGTIWKAYKQERV